MNTKVYADKFETADLTSTNKYQIFKVKKPIACRYIKTWVLVFNNPTYTHLNAKIYTIDEDKAAVKLLYTSTNTQSKADVCTLDYGYKEIWFKFNDVSLHGESQYALVINGSGYTATSGSYLGWLKDYPDKLYPSSGGGHYQMMVIGSDF